MAGSGKYKGQEELKNKAMLVVRNITKQEVTNVIFPNGITVGADGAKFSNGMRIHGNAQVSGVVNAQGFKVNGQDLNTGQPFLFLDVNSYAAAFDDTSDSSPTPSSIGITVTQQSQASTLVASDITATDALGNSLSITGFNATTASTGNSTAVATLNISSLGRSSFPVTITASNDSLTSTKTIVKVVGGDDGNPGSDGDDGDTGAAAKSVGLRGSVTQITYDSNGLNPSPSSVTLTAASQNFSNGYYRFTGGGSAFTDESGYTDGASANQDTATFTAPASYSSTPYTFTVSVQEGSSGGEVASDILTIGSVKEQVSTFREELTLDLHQSFLGNLGSSEEGHWSITDNGFATTDGPPAAGIIKTGLIFSAARAIGTPSDAAVDDNLDTGLSSVATYNGLPFYRVPSGSQLTITRMIGFLNLAGVSCDINLTMHVYRTKSADNGATDVEMVRLGQIKIADSANSFRVRTDGGVLLDTGAVTASVSASHGIALFIHVDAVNGSGSVSSATGTLTMEYTLS